jgi:hypothetical protein
MHSWQCFYYVMKTCGMNWNVSNEDKLFKNMH